MSEVRTDKISGKTYPKIVEIPLNTGGTHKLNDLIDTSESNLVGTFDDMVMEKGYHYDARAYGSTFDDTTIQSAINAIGSLERTLVIPPGTWTLSSDVTVPSNINLKVLSGGLLTVVTGKTLTISGSLEAGLYQIFDCVGTGSVSFGSPTTIYPEWWGIDGVEDEIELQAAIDSNPGGTIMFSANGYTLTSAGISVITSGTTLKCLSMYCTLSTYADITLLTMGGTSLITVENIACNNHYSPPSYANYVMLDLTKHCKLINPYSIKGKYGIQMGSVSQGVFYNTIENPWVYYATDYSLYMFHSAVNQNRILGGMLGTAYGKSGDMAYLRGNMNLLKGISFEGVGGDDFSSFAIIENGLNIIRDNRFETDSNGVLVNNTSRTQSRGSKIYSNYWACLPSFVVIQSGRVFTDTFAAKQTFSGFIIGGNKANKLITGAGALIGDTSIPMNDTDGFYIGQQTVIAKGTANEEFHVVDGVVANNHIVILGGLQYDQAAGVNVLSEGNAYGQLCRPDHSASVNEYWAQGVPVMELDSIDSTLKIDGVSILGPQQTGVAPMTNLTAVSNLDANTVTTPELADIVGNLINKLRIHGLVKT